MERPIAGRIPNNKNNNAEEPFMSRERAPTLDDFIAGVTKRNPGQTEFIQAVTEVAEDVLPFVEKHPKYNELQLLERDSDYLRGRLR